MLLKCAPAVCLDGAVDTAGRVYGLAECCAVALRSKFGVVTSQDGIALSVSVRAAPERQVPSSWLDFQQRLERLSVASSCRLGREPFYDGWWAHRTWEETT